MSNANIDGLNGQAVLDLIMGRLGRKDSAVEHWKGPFRTDRKPNGLKGWKNRLMQLKKVSSAVV